MALVRYPWALIQAVTTAGTIHPNTIRTPFCKAMVNKGRTSGAGELKMLEKVGDISPWLQEARMLRGEDSLAFVVPESPRLDAWSQVLGLGPRLSGRSTPAFTPEIYLVTSGTPAGSSISCTVLVLSLSSSSCIRCSRFCSNVIFLPFHLNPWPSELLQNFINNIY